MRDAINEDIKDELDKNELVIIKLRHAIIGDVKDDLDTDKLKTLWWSILYTANWKTVTYMDISI